VVRQAVAREGYRRTRGRAGGHVGAADEGENLATNRLGQGWPAGHHFGKIRVHRQCRRSGDFCADCTGFRTDFGRNPSISVVLLGSFES